MFVSHLCVVPGNHASKSLIESRMVGDPGRSTIPFYFNDLVTVFLRCDML